jgi:hypothetical protein
MRAWGRTSRCDLRVEDLKVSLPSEEFALPSEEGTPYNVSMT